MKIVMGADPVTGNQGGHQTALQAAAVFVIDVFDTGRLFETG